MAKTFIMSLFKAMGPKECLLIELNDDVIDIIGSDDAHRMGKVTWIMKLSDFPNLKRDKSTYSNFKRLIIIDDGKSLQMDIEKNKNPYICEIVIETEEKNPPSTGADNEIKGQGEVKGDGDNTGHVAGEEEQDYDIFNLFDVDDNDGDNNRGLFIRFSPVNDDSSASKTAKLNIKQTNGSTSVDNFLTLKNACGVDILRSEIYKKTTQFYEIKDNSIDAFYLGLALDYKEIFTSKEIIYVEKDCLFRKTLSSADIDIHTGCLLKLFLKLIQKNKLEASLYYWSRADHPIVAALLAQYILKENLKTAHTQNEKEKCTKFLKIYEDIAIGILNSCYNEDRKSTWYLLVKDIPDFNESCITVALKTDNKQFLQHQACAEVNSVNWSKYLGKDLGKNPGKDLDFFSKLQPNIRETFLSPKGRCRMDMIAYLMFLTAYSFLLVSTLHQTTFHWLEAVVIVYLIIFFIKEFDQCWRGISKSPKQCWYYISDPFNILDLLSIGIAIMAWSLRLAAYVNPEEQRVMTAARYLLCLNFMLYMYRFQEFFYQNKLLGPMLVVIKDMVNTYIHFLLILAIFFVSYCVVSESILYPEKEITRTIVYTVFRRGFWAMMGEYSLEEVEHYSDDACIDNHQVNSTCPTADGRYTIPILLAGYVLFVQILMFNLLVALFNKAITENETKREMIWIYQRFKLTMQYAETKILLPPFLPLLFFMVRKVGNPFKSNLTEDFIKLKDFEQNKVQKYYSLYNRDGSEVSNDHTTKNDKSMETMIKHMAENDKSMKTMIKHMAENEKSMKTMIKHILDLQLKQSNTSKLPDQFDDTQICGLLSSPNLCSNDQPNSGSLKRQALNVVVESSSMPCDNDAITTDVTSTA